MKCQNCDNQKFERLDFAIVMCTQFQSLFDPFIYPGFPEPDVELGEIWDTSDDEFDDWKSDL